MAFTGKTIDTGGVGFLPTPQSSGIDLGGAFSSLLNVGKAITGQKKLQDEKDAKFTISETLSDVASDLTKAGVGRQDASFVSDLIAGGKSGSIGPEELSIRLIAANRRLVSIFPERADEINSAIRSRFGKTGAQIALQTAESNAERERVRTQLMLDSSIKNGVAVFDAAGHMDQAQSLQAQLDFSLADGKEKAALLKQKRNIEARKGKLEQASLSDQESLNVWLTDGGASAWDAAFSEKMNVAFPSLMSQIEIATAGGGATSAVFAQEILPAINQFKQVQTLKIMEDLSGESPSVRANALSRMNAKIDPIIKIFNEDGAGALKAGEVAVNAMKNDSEMNVMKLFPQLHGFMRVAGEFAPVLIAQNKTAKQSLFKFTSSVFEMFKTPPPSSTSNPGKIDDYMKSKEGEKQTRAEVRATDKTFLQALPKQGKDLSPETTKAGFEALQRSMEQMVPDDVEGILRVTLHKDMFAEIQRLAASENPAEVDSVSSFSSSALKLQARIAREVITLNRREPNPLFADPGGVRHAAVSFDDTSGQMVIEPLPIAGGTAGGPVFASSQTIPTEMLRHQERYNGLQRLRTSIASFTVREKGTPVPVTPDKEITPIINLPSVVFETIRKHEGERLEAYEDPDASGPGGFNWRIGFGSDTITDENGDVRTVKEGDVITAEDAERDLSRRAPAFQKDGIIKFIGEDAFSALTDNQKAAITSLVYNYGSLSGLPTLTKLLKKGVTKDIAAEIRKRGADNGGINKKRRNSEADLFEKKS